MAKKRMSMVSGGAVLVALAAAGFVSAAVSPSAQVAATLAAGAKARSVYYVVDETHGSSKVTMTSRAGVTEGEQGITIAKGGRTGHVTVILGKRGVYVRGDLVALTSYMGFAETSAKKIVGKWILLPPANKGYKSIADGLTVSTAMNDLKIKPPFRTSAPMVINGKKATGIQGSSSVLLKKPVATTLYADPATQLPVREVIVHGSTRATITFSRWNQPLHISVPTKLAVIGSATNA